ncbi:hypothetical protein [Bacillus sp. FJAT-47783]|uniref:hypothetical protein n=1 Tax=Bacillus sp. FJAT-47783 TaxID=2922712 RepID=UPI001FAC717A|nr:hypothetical protein [Bacillus sp. FJAT-47783]
MKKNWWIFIIISLLIALSFYLSKRLAVKESIIFFPLSENVLFTDANTTVSLIEKKNAEDHILEWDVHSATSEEIYLRQDISLLFVDGELKHTMAEWEDHSQKLAQYEKITGQDSSHYETISFHYGEIHENEEKIRSVQKMSEDHLYVIDSSFSKLTSFKNPVTEEEAEWKEILDHIQSQQLHYRWERLIGHFQINPSQYIQFPLTDLPKYNEKPLEGFTKNETQTIIGTLWEGLYKQYFLGLKRKDGSIEDPIGSSLPLLLLAKDKTHLIVLIEGKSGYPYQLYQKIIEVEESI